MRVIIVARNKNGKYAPFVTEQVAALEKLGVDCRFFPVKSKGVGGYLKSLPSLRKTIKEFQPDIVHAHYGLCGLLANLQQKVPVVTTYHGSDINDPKVRRLSKIAIFLSAFNIFVSQKCIDLVKPRKNYALIPCGINLDDFPEIDKAEARRQMGLNPNGRYVLFAGAFDNPVKNAPLAKEAIAQFPGVELLELKGYSRTQVAILMQAVDVLLMTSVCEGSPQVIKEALACGCPIVSVDVGDVKERTKGVEGCFVSTIQEPKIITVLFQKALFYESKTNGREKIINDNLNNRQVAQRLIDLYQKVCVG